MWKKCLIESPQSKLRKSKKRAAFNFKQQFWNTTFNDETSINFSYICICTFLDQKIPTVFKLNLVVELREKVVKQIRDQSFLRMIDFDASNNYSIKTRLKTKNCFQTPLSTFGGTKINCKVFLRIARLAQWKRTRTSKLNWFFIRRSKTLWSQSHKFEPTW